MLAQWGSTPRRVRFQASPHVTPTICSRNHKTPPPATAAFGLVLPMFTFGAFSSVAGRSSMEGNDGLVDFMMERGIVHTQHVEDAMRAVDRAKFVPHWKRLWAYDDRPLLIGYGATISAPHMHAHCLELMADVLKPGAKVLDVGSGSGYLTAVLAHMVQGASDAFVVGVEHVPKLVETSFKSVRQIEFVKKLMEEGKMAIVKADGRYGYPQKAPYDCIHVGAASPKVPGELVDQLRAGGRLLIPVGNMNSTQTLTQVDKDIHGKVVTKPILDVKYVPLTSLYEQTRF